MNYSDLKEDKRLIEAVPTARQIAYESSGRKQPQRAV